MRWKCLCIFELIEHFLSFSLSLSLSRYLDLSIYRVHILFQVKDIWFNYLALFISHPPKRTITLHAILFSGSGLEFRLPSIRWILFVALHEFVNGLSMWHRRIYFFAVSSFFSIDLSYFLFLSSSNSDSDAIFQYLFWPHSQIRSYVSFQFYHKSIC